MDTKVVKVIGFAATVVGMGMTLIANWSNAKLMDDKIAEKVNEALAEAKKIES
jgi:hypothetical protein